MSRKNSVAGRKAHHENLKRVAAALVEKQEKERIKRLGRPLKERTVPKNLVRGAFARSAEFQHRILRRVLLFLVCVWIARTSKAACFVVCFLASKKSTNQCWSRPKPREPATLAPVSIATRHPRILNKAPNPTTMDVPQEQ